MNKMKGLEKWVMKLRYSQWVIKTEENLQNIFRSSSKERIYWGWSRTSWELIRSTNSSSVSPYRSLWENGKLRSSRRGKFGMTVTEGIKVHLKTRFPKPSISPVGTLKFLWNWSMSTEPKTETKLLEMKFFFRNIIKFFRTNRRIRPIRRFPSHLDGSLQYKQKENVEHIRKQSTTRLGQELKSKLGLNFDEN